MKIQLDSNNRVIGFMLFTKNDIEDTDVLKTISNTDIPAEFGEKYTEYSYINSELVHVGKTDEQASMELSEAKKNKISEFKENKALKIGENTFSTKRIDIQKYKEATDIRENANERTVNFQVLEGKIELSIAEARDIIKTLSEEAYNDFWVKKDFENLVDACNTIEAVESVTTPLQ